MTAHLQSLATFIPGRPAPQGSKRHVGGGRMIEASKYVKPWREQVSAATAGWEPLDGPVEVHLQFVLPRPASERKTFTRPHTRRPDVDKLARAVLDGITGHCFADDSQVTCLVARKRTAQPEEAPGVHLFITPDPGAPL